MNAAIAEPRAEVGETAPKIISFEIPIDKIGEVIGPKGKVINAIQQETGADITVDDDGMVGTVTIGSTDGGAVAEAERQIKLILNPPTAEVGADLHGPGREHHQVRCVRQHPPGPRRPGPHLQARRRQAHRPGRGRASTSATRSRCGSTTSTRNGKVSLSPVGDGSTCGPAAASGGGERRRGAASARRPRDAAPASAAPETVSFEDAFDAEVARSSATSVPPRRRRGGGGRGGDRGGGGRGRGAASRQRPAVAAVAIAERSRIERTALANGHPRRHRAHARGPVGARPGCWVGVGGRATSPVAGRRRRTSSSTCCSRAPTTRSAARHRRGGRRGRRRDERLHRQGAHRVLHAAAGERMRARPRPAVRRAHRAGVPRRRDRGRAPGDPRGAPHGRGHARRPSSTPCCSRRCSPTTRSAARCSAPPTRSTAIARERHRRLLRRAVPPANIVVAAAGAIEHDDVVDAVERGSAPRRRWRPREPPPPALDATRRSRRSVRDDRAGAPRRRHARASTATTRTATRSPCSNHVLGGGMSSRLFQRDPRGARAGVLGVLAARRSTRRRALLTIYAGTAPDERRGARPHRRRARPARAPTASPTTSSPSPSATSRARSCSASRTRQPHGPPRAAR